MNKHIRRPLPARGEGGARLQDKYYDTKARIREWVSESEKGCGGLKRVNITYARERAQIRDAAVPRRCTR